MDDETHRGPATVMVTVAQLVFAFRHAAISTIPRVEA